MDDSGATTVLWRTRLRLSVFESGNRGGGGLQFGLSCDTLLENDIFREARKMF